ncbi:unnamed protein product [Aureobasidium mustum]|uniref:Uncharacterized protein n=1 Tax=Aureobasidium mustum TaxID=2773714 RepID=A0A9N8JV74_9PEZI|nr:unnamed protein product [Aureobasidium mustum]
MAVRITEGKANYFLLLMEAQDLRMHHLASPISACAFHATARSQNHPTRSSRRRPSSLRKKVAPKDIVKFLVIEILQQQHEIAKSQAEILNTQHSNYHTLLEITENMQHTISHIQAVKEDVQVSDKIAFAAGFGCGLLVLLGIWLYVHKKPGAWSLTKLD